MRYEYRDKCIKGGGDAMNDAWKYTDLGVPLSAMMEVGFFPKNSELREADVMFLIGSDGAAFAYISGKTETGYPVLGLMRAAPDLPLPERATTRRAA